MKNFIATAIVVSQMILMAVGVPANLTLQHGNSVEPLGILYPKPPTCGSETGTFVQMEVTGCTTGSNSGAACPMTALFYYEIAVDFIPTKTTNTLYYYIRFLPNTGSPIGLAVVQVPGTYTAGRTYRVQHEVEIPTTMKGKYGKINAYLSDTQYFVIDRCFYVTVAA